MGREANVSMERQETFNLPPRGSIPPRPSNLMEEKMWLTGTGIIRYDPPRPGLKTRIKWWCVVDIDREITRYYRWWVKKELRQKGKML